jgi:hypothetical protein
LSKFAGTVAHPKFVCCLLVYTSLSAYLLAVETLPNTLIEIVAGLLLITTSFSPYLPLAWSTRSFSLRVRDYFQKFGKLIIAAIRAKYYEID